MKTVQFTKHQSETHHVKTPFGFLSTRDFVSLLKGEKSSCSSAKEEIGMKYKLVVSNADPKEVVGGSIIFVPNDVEKKTKMEIFEKFLEITIKCFLAGFFNMEFNKISKEQEEWNNLVKTQNRK